MKKAIAALLILFLLFALLFVRIYRIEGISMCYGLTDGDVVLSSRLVGTIERGDILIFAYPGDKEGNLFIKRCVALPHDRFFQKDRSFYLQIEGNSSKTAHWADRYRLELASTTEGYFIKDPYLKYYGVVHDRGLLVPPPLRDLNFTMLPEGEYYMMGDFRDNSADSRFFGPVQRAWIFSKVRYIVKKPKPLLELMRLKMADEGNVSSLYR